MTWHLNAWQFALLWSAILCASVAYWIRVRPTRTQRELKDLRRRHRAVLRDVARSIRTLDDRTLTPLEQATIVQRRLEWWRPAVHDLIPRESPRADR